MDFDFDDDVQPTRSNEPITETSIASALDKAFIQCPKPLLGTILNAIPQFKSFDDMIYKLETFLSIKSAAILNSKTFENFLQEHNLDAMADMDLENDDTFAPGSEYNRDLDQVTKAVLRKTATSSSSSSSVRSPPFSSANKSFNTTTHPDSGLLSPSKSPFTPRNAHLSPATTATKRANTYRTETPTTSNRRRSHWTPLLTSPSTTFPDHHQKGQVLVRFAPKRPAAVPSTSSTNTTISEIEKQSQLSQSTRMFDEADAPLSSTGPTTPPIFVLSWIHQARLEKRRQTQAKAQGIYIPEHQIDPNDPLRIDNTPFRYMDWNHQKALTKTMSREGERIHDLLDAQAYILGLQTLAGSSAKRLALEAAKNNGATPIKTTTTQTTTNTDENGDEEDIRPVFCENFTQQQIRDVWYAGHIKNTLTTKDARLNTSTLVLSNYSSECPLRLTHKDLKHYSFFPGQVVVCRATNITGGAITPDLILTETTLANYTRRRWITAYWSMVHGQAYKKQQLAQLAAASAATTTATTTSNPVRKSLFGGADDTAILTTTHAAATPATQLVPTVDDLVQVVTNRPVKVMYCAGPFVSAKGKTQSLSAIFDHINDELNVPDVLIISGPFIDVDTPGSILRPTHTPTTTLDYQQDFYHRKQEDNSAQQQPVSLCNVPVYKSDVFSQYKSQQAAKVHTNYAMKDDISAGAAAAAVSTPSPNTSLDDLHEGQNISLFGDLFQETMNHIITTLNANPLTQNVTVITIPSTRDVHHFACFPQPGYEYTYQPPSPYVNNTVKVINAPNPCQLDINGVCFGATTADVMSELSRYELFVQKVVEDGAQSPFATPSTTGLTSTLAGGVNTTPSKMAPSELVQLGSPVSPSTSIVPGKTTGICAKDKRIVRLMSHILSQQSFAPIPTLQANPSIDNARTSLDLICKPDILLLPSKIRHFIEPIPMPGQLSSNQRITDPTPEFIKEHGHVLAINPNATIQGEGLGCFATITIYNNQNSGEERVDVVDRVHAEIIHL